MQPEGTTGSNSEDQREPDGDDDLDPIKSESKPKEKRSRRRGIIFCKHGCGYRYEPPSSKKSGGDRKLRDQFDYHEQQKCPELPRLVCPLECQYRGKVLSFAGQKALRQHLKTKSHVLAVEVLEREKGPEAVKKVDYKEVREESEFAPHLVHGNPRINGFRRHYSDGEEPLPPRRKQQPVRSSKRNKKSAPHRTVGQSWSDSNEDDVFDEEDDEELLLRIFGDNNDGNDDEEEDFDTLQFGRTRKGRRPRAKRGRERSHKVESSGIKFIETDSLRVSRSQERVSMLAAFASQVLCSLDDSAGSTENTLVVLESPAFAQDREVAVNEFSRMLGLLVSASKKYRSFQYI